jgi:uncharacterized protein YkwD
MKKNLVLFLSLFAALATSSLAQTDNFQDQRAVVVVGRAAASRLRADEKAVGVKASVIVNTAAVERAAFELLNQKRVENGLKPLAWSDQLAGIARLHSQNMADLKFFSHRGLDNKMVSDRADDIGLSKWRAIGENIAFERGYQDPVSKAVELWLDSPSHRHNLLESTWKESAVGVAVAPDGSFYFTQVFLLRK